MAWLGLFTRPTARASTSTDASTQRHVPVKVEAILVRAEFQTAPYVTVSLLPTNLHRQIVQPTFKPTIVTNSESLSDPLAERSQSFYRLVAEHKADMAVGYSASPAAHRGGGDLVFQETLGDFEAVKTQGRDVQKQ